MKHNRKVPICKKKKGFSLVQENLETLKKTYDYFSSLSRDKFAWVRGRFVNSICLDLTLDEDEEYKHFE